MINIMIPIAGKAGIADANAVAYPKPMVEISGHPLIEIVIENLSGIHAGVQFIFIVKNDDCDKFHLDKVLNLLTDHQCTIIQIKGETKGAACSALMAVDHIMNDTPLIIANFDQVFDYDLGKVVRFFGDQEADGGVVIFDSVHPRWSYVRLGEGLEIVETAEKTPISRNAIAGFYYFKHGKFFVQATTRSILKDNHINGTFFIAPVYNELILDSRKLIAYRIKNEHYHPLYTPQKIRDYQECLRTPR